MARTQLHGFIMDGDARWGMYLAALRAADAERWLDVAIALEDGGTVAVRVWLSGERVRACILDPAESNDHPALVLGHWMSERAVQHQVPEVIAVVRNVLAHDVRLRDHLGSA